MIFVVYMGGTVGDFVTAMIDWKDSHIDALAERMSLPLHRQRLKKPHGFATAEEKDLYVKTMAEDHGYLSLPSHDLDYHLDRGHNVIGITVTDPLIAKWAADRFKRVHRKQVWESVCQANGIKNTRQYADLMLHYSNMLNSKVESVIKMEDVLGNNLLRELSTKLGLGFSQTDINRYQLWYKVITGKMVY